MGIRSRQGRRPRHRRPDDVRGLPRRDWAQAGRGSPRNARGRDGPPGQEPVRHRGRLDRDFLALGDDDEGDVPRPDPAADRAGPSPRPRPPGSGRAKEGCTSLPTCWLSFSRPTTKREPSATASASPCRSCSSGRRRSRRWPLSSTSWRRTRSSMVRSRRQAGTVDVSRAPRDDSEVVIVWTERGGPPVSAPREPTGFGSQLVTRSISSQLGGTIAFDWPAEGVIVTLRMSKARLGT